nr:hypothetical protein [Tanacetum cinerariifolium]
MDVKSAQNNVVAKLPLLKQGNYEIWKSRIEQYFQVQDYALWDVIENGNSFNPIPRITANADGTFTLTISGPFTIEEKAHKKNDVKARSMLLMALPNEHLLTFSQYKDAKTLFEAIQARFDGNEATKKTLLKQMYENFNAPSTESLDSIFNRLQKIVSQLAIMGENISQKDISMKFLRSLPTEWNTHVVVWRNKPDLKTMSFDDIYNNFKIVEQEVKKNISAVSTPVSTICSLNNTANLSDATVYAFLANQPNGSLLVHEDLEQIHDLEEMGLKWQLALLSMREKRYFQRTCKKITINGSDTAGYDKTKVECFNCHKMRHFARECRSPRSQESRPRNQDSSKKTVIVEDTSSKAMVAIDGAGFDWSYMGDDEVFDCDEDVSEEVVVKFENVQHKPEHVNQPRKENQNPRNNRTNWNQMRTQKLGVGFQFSKKACFVCGSFCHLIKDCDFHNKKMIQKHVLTTVEKGSSQREVRPVWNHAMRVNHQNFSNSRRNISPAAVLTKSGIVPISTTRQSSSRVAAPISTARPINTAAPKPIVNVAKSRQNAFQKTHSLSRRPFHQQISLKNRYLVNTAKVKSINTPKGKSVTSAVGKQGSNAVKSSACWVWRPKIKETSPFCQTIKNVMEDLLLLQAVLKEMCDKNNSVLFTETECLILSPDFKLPDENQVLLKGNLVRGLPLNIFKNDHTCVACQKGKQHKASFLWDKGIKREFSNAWTSQQNRVAKRKNRTLIEAARTMLTDSLLPIPFCAEAVNIACYVHNRVLVTKPHNKTPYKLLISRAPIISFMRPFGCPVTILNTLDHLRKFDGKAKEGFLVGYLKIAMLLEYTIAELRRTNGIACSKIHSDVGKEGKGKVSNQEYILLPVLNASSDVPSSNEEVKSSPKDDVGKKSIEEPTCVERGKIDDLGCLDQQMKSTDDSENTNSTNNFNTVSPTVNTTSDKDGIFQRTYAALDDFSKMPNLEDTGIFDDAYNDRDEGVEADYNNLETTKIHVDNESVICVVKNPVYHSKTNHIKIRHHFIKDSYEKRSIEMVKNHTDSNVADLHTKAFDVTRFQFLVASIGIELKGYLLNDGYTDLVQHADKKELAILEETTTGKEFSNSLMAGSLPKTISAKFFDQHNMVTYLEKSDDNIEFHQILDFLSSCSITYALTLPLSTYSNLLLHINKKKTQTNRRTQKDTELPQTIVPLNLRVDEAVYQEEGDRVERAITTNASLEVAHDSDHIIKTQTTMMPNVDIPQGIDTGGRPRRQETMRDTSAQTRSERVLVKPNESPLTKGHTLRSREGRLEENIELMNTVPTPHDLPLTRGYTPGSDEGRITLAKLMETCTILSNKVTQLETELLTTKAIYNKASITLTNRVKKLESQLKQKRSKAIIHSSDEEGPSVHIEDSPKQERIVEEMDKDENINLVNKQGEVQETVKHLRDDDEILAKTLLNIKRSSAKDKGKGIMQETDLPKKLKKNEMIHLSLDEELAQKVQSYLKGMKYEDIRSLFKRIWDQVYTFVPKDYKIEREVMKRAGFDLQQGSSKKQRLDQQTEETKEEGGAQSDSDQEVEELKLYMRIIAKEDIAIKVTPLAVKPLVIIKYRTVKEEKKSELITLQELMEAQEDTPQ